MPMLAFPYYWLDTIGLSDVTFNTHYLPDSVRRAAMHVVNPATQLHFSHENAILGSGGGIWNARFHLQPDDTFAVANGDGVVVFENPHTIEEMLAFHRRQGALATLLVCPLEGVGTRIPGVWLDKYGEVANFGKTGNKDYLECLHYASIMFISKRVWDYMPEGESNILYDVFTNAMAQGEKVFGYRVDNMRWFETGNSAEYLAATRTCLEFLRDGGPLGASLRGMLERFAADYSLRSDLEKLQLIAGTSHVGVNVNLKGFNVLGANAHVGDGVSTQDCVLLPGAELSPGRSAKSEVII